MGEESPILFHPLCPKGSDDVHLDTVVKPYTRSHLLSLGTYQLVVIVAAANAKATRKTLEIRLTGNWYDDEQEMLSQGISIRLLD